MKWAGGGEEEIKESMVTCNRLAVHSGREVIFIFFVPWVLPFERAGGGRGKGRGVPHRKDGVGGGDI